LFLTWPDLLVSMFTIGIGACLPKSLIPSERLQDVGLGER
jgi:hypothetical protein